MNQELVTTATPPPFPAPAISPGAVAVADPAALAAAEAAKERLRAAFIMARQFPRNEEIARQKILSACNRPLFAANAEYRKPIGRDHIVGPSIRLAEELIRNWGNISAETSIVFEDDRIRRVAVSVIDLETNTRHTREIVIQKTVERRQPGKRQVISKRQNSSNQTVYLVKPTDDEIMIKEAALVSKAIRNESLRCIPSDILEEAIDRARRTCLGEFTEDPKATVKKLTDAFAKLRVTVDMLEEYLSHLSISAAYTRRLPTILRTGLRSLR